MVEKLVNASQNSQEMVLEGAYGSFRAITAMHVWGH
jgi:hypothetical protein